MAISEMSPAVCSLFQMLLLFVELSCLLSRLFGMFVVADLLILSCWQVTTGSHHLL